MRNKSILKQLSLALCGLLLLVMAGCKENFWKTWVVAPPAYIEPIVKGHDQVYHVQVILRIAQMHKYEELYLKLSPEERSRRRDDFIYAGYNPRTEPTPVPVYQEITLDRDESGNMVITSPRQVFDVVKSTTKNLYYMLELRYYDINNQLINHQFSGFYPDEEDVNNSTLSVHQHFFVIDYDGLRAKDSDQNKFGGWNVVYPMTLDSIYIDDYLFGKNVPREPATVTDALGVYMPVDGYTPNTLKYDADLAMLAASNVRTPKATKPIEKNGRTYRLYKSLPPSELNKMSPDLFDYEYRDTDPVNGELGETMGMPDDLRRGLKDRINIQNKVIRLRKYRDLNEGMIMDHLGFKGKLSFNKAHITFQMRIGLCHATTINTSCSAENARMGTCIYGKYDQKPQGNNAEYRPRDSYDINLNWNSWDLDYSLPFRVMADADGDEATFVKDVKRYYPNANEKEIAKMFNGETDYFYRFPQVQF